MSHANVIKEQMESSPIQFQLTTTSYKLEKFTKRKLCIICVKKNRKKLKSKTIDERSCDYFSGKKKFIKWSSSELCIKQQSKCQHQKSSKKQNDKHKTTTTTINSIQQAIKTVISRPSSRQVEFNKPAASLLLIILVCTSQNALELNLASSSSGANAAIADQYQVVGQANEQVQLPCLIGRQLFCGEPYFIAWYKLNSSTKTWTRIEHQTNDQDNQQQQQQQQQFVSSSSSSLSSTSVSQQQSGANSPPVNNERVRFTWSRSNGRPQQLACDQLLANHAKLFRPRASLPDWSNNFDCGQLTISQVELFDEGQYKCEITFSEYLDYDRCPTTTLSQLNVIALPNEPELLVNGQRFDGQRTTTLASGSFKEGAQVKLECQSSGGKPAPRIEWLNVSVSSSPAIRSLVTSTNNNNQFQEDDQTTRAADEQADNDDDSRLLANLDPTRTEIQLMRLHWPQKKTFVSEQSLSSKERTSSNSIQWQPSSPITSSSVSISLSRFDLNSRFLCLVLPSSTPNTNNQQQLQQQQQLYTEQLIKSATYLSSLLINQQQQQQQQQRASANGAASSSGNINNNNKLIASSRPMLKWIKLDVQVKPSKVSLIVREAESGAVLEEQNSELMGGFYSLRPNKAYAIQCLVHESRPKSQVAWFNRTAPIGLEPIDLGTTTDSSAKQLDFLMPTETTHRLSSFTRTTRHPSGTFSTIATLVLTTNFWDNFEEIFCRASNEAFEFDQLIQVAPIISARLYINYSPLAWLEPVDTAAAAGKQHNLLRLDVGAQLDLRCWVSANPLSKSAIVQIDWLKDGRKLTSSAGSNASQQTNNNNNRHRQLTIERANHLHIPTATQQTQLDFIASQSAAAASSSATTVNAARLLPTTTTTTTGNQLVAGSKLISSSLLTISALTKSDSGLYSCQFKLIPTPYVQSLNTSSSSQQQPIRITSGQAASGITLSVIEAKPSAPIIRVQSSKSLLVYTLQPHQQHKQQQQHHGTRTTTTNSLLAVGEPGAIVSLRCDIESRAPLVDFSSGARKVVWYSNGQTIHSSATSNTYSLILEPNSTQQQQLSSITCAHHISTPATTAAHQLAPRAEQTTTANAASGGLMRIYQSANEFDLKVRVRARLLQRRELMPHVRSFSELELSARPGNKLSVACLAQCEPSLCSIDWLLNGRQLSPATAAADKVVPTKLTDFKLAAGVNGDSQQLSLAAKRLFQVTIGPQDNNEQENQQQHQHQHRLSFVSVDTLTRSSNNNSLLASTFGWLKTSTLSVLPARLDSSASSSSTSSLLQEMQSSGANVASRLELTYYQLSQLLVPSSHSERQQKNVLDELDIRCKLNSIFSMLDASDDNDDDDDDDNEKEMTMKFARVQPFVWFPSAVASTFEDESQYDNEQHWASLLTKWPTVGDRALNLSESLYDQDDEQKRAAAAASNQSSSNSPAHQSDINNKQQADDDMQISIMLDAGPRDMMISFAGRQVSSSSSELDGSAIGDSSIGLTLVDSQLLELLDPNKAPPMLHCSVLGKVYPSVQFKWTFTDLNNTQHSIDSTHAALTGANGAELNLRQFVEMRQLLVNINKQASSLLLSSSSSSNSIGQQRSAIELIGNVVGNYTCTASNIHGTKSVSLPLQIQGRPMCKLRLGGQYLSNDNELMVTIVCSIYSAPNLLETVWFRGSQQVAVNKSSSVWESKQQQQALSNVELQIMVLNKQQEFLLADLINQMANFKCIARNSLGYSEACELKHLDRESLLKTSNSVRVETDKSSAISMLTFASDASGMAVAPPLVLKQPMLNFLSNSSGGLDQHLSIFQQQQQQKQQLDLANNNNNNKAYINNNNNNIGNYSSSVFGNLFARTDLILVTLFSLVLVWVLLVVGSVFVRRQLAKWRRGSWSSSKHNTNWRFNSATRQLATPTTNRTSSNNNNNTFQSKISVNYYGDSNGDSEHDMIQSCSQSSHYEDFVQHQKRQLAMTQQQQQQHQPQHQQHQFQLHHQPIYFNPNQRSLISSSTLNPSSCRKQQQQQHYCTQQQQHLLQQQQQQLKQQTFAGPTTISNNNEHIYDDVICNYL